MKHRPVLFFLFFFFFSGRAQEQLDDHLPTKSFSDLQNGGVQAPTGGVKGPGLGPEAAKKDPRSA